jgi:hypothetical protein
MFWASSVPIIMEFSTVHSALVGFMQVFDDRIQAASGWNGLTLLGSGHQNQHETSTSKQLGWNIVTLLGSSHQNLHETYQCQMYSRKLRDDERRRCPKHVEFYNRKNLDNWCVWLDV